MNTRLVKVAKVERAMKKLETSYNTPDWTLIEGDKPGAEEEKSEEIAAAPFAESAAMVQVHYVYKCKSCLGSRSS